MAVSLRLGPRSVCICGACDCRFVEFHDAELRFSRSGTTLHLSVRIPDTLQCRVSSELLSSRLFPWSGCGILASPCRLRFVRLWVVRFGLCCFLAWLSYLMFVASGVPASCSYFFMVHGCFTWVGVSFQLHLWGLWLLIR